MLLSPFYFFFFSCPADHFQFADVSFLGRDRYLESGILELFPLREFGIGNVIYIHPYVKFTPGRVILTVIVFNTGI